MKIERLEAQVLTVPTDRHESDGTIAWDATTMVLVRAHAEGTTGLGWTFAHGAAAELVEGPLAAAVRGVDVSATSTAFMAMNHAMRNIGRPGLGWEAISAVDIALWDLRARTLSLPLARLFGTARESVPAYGSGGFTSYDDETLRAQLGGWAREGFRAVKMKVGRHPEEDLRRVRTAREAIGPDVGLFVDANGACSVKQALAQAEAFAGCGVTWFEEPVSSEDLAGLRFVRDRAPAGMDDHRRRVRLRARRLPTTRRGRLPRRRPGGRDPVRRLHRHPRGGRPVRSLRAADVDALRAAPARARRVRNPAAAAPRVLPRPRADRAARCSTGRSSPRDG